MPKTRDDVRRDLLKIMPLPEGYSMEPEGDDDFIVRGPHLGFAITRKDIDDNRHLAMYPAALKQLIECEESKLYETHPHYFEWPSRSPQSGKI
jgi:hypothetical protein